MAEIAIEAEGLRKVFAKDVVAVDGLDLQVPRGAVYGLIGRNAVGKTTTIRLLMGLLRPTAGTARVLGADMWTAQPVKRARVAYVAQIQQLHDWMSLQELCHYLSHFYERWDQGYARDLAGRFDIPWDRQVGLLSGGQQRKVSIVLAFAARPEVLLLDEPAAGLDPIARRELVEELVDLLSRDVDCTVLFSTHIISDLERIAEYVGIMDNGRMVASQRLDELQSQTKRVQVVFDGTAPPPDFSIPGALRSEASGPVVTAVVRLASEAQLDPVRRLPGVRVNVFPLGLEDIFFELFGPKARQELTGERQ